MLLPVWFLRYTLLGIMSLCLLPVALISQDSLPSQLQRLKLGQRRPPADC